MFSLFFFFLFVSCFLLGGFERVLTLSMFVCTRMFRKEHPRNGLHTPFFPLVFRLFAHQRVVAQPSHKGLLLKKKLGKAIKQNRPLPPWFRQKTGNTIRYNSKRRHWRRTKLGL